MTPYFFKILIKKYKLLFFLFFTICLLISPSFVFGQKEPSIPAKRVPVYHIVKKGETLSSIAKKYGTTVQNIKKLNKLKSSTIYPGQKLIVKYKIVRPKLLVQTIQKNNYKIINYYHIVKKGENLSSIAQKYGTTVQNIKKLNKLRSSTIYPGQKLIVYQKKIPIKKSTKTLAQKSKKETAQLITTKTLPAKKVPVYHIVKTHSQKGRNFILYR